MSFTILLFLISFFMPSIKFAFLLIVPVQFSLFCSLEIFHDLFRTEFIRFMSGTLVKHFIPFHRHLQAFIGKVLAIQTLQEYGANREAVGEFLPMQWADIGYGVKEMSGGEVP